MADDNADHTDGAEQQSSVPVSRRGVLAAGSALGLGLAAGAGSASAQSGDEQGGGAPFADEDHDHADDYLGEETPVERIDVDRVDANAVSTTRYADSIAEVNEYIDEARDERHMSEYSGVRIVLRQGKLEPSPDDLPIELKSGVVIQGQGQKATVIDVEEINKPVFKLDRSGETIRRHVELRDLRVIGDNTLAGSIDSQEGSKGVLFRNVHYYLIENCDFIGLEDGIVLPGSWTGTIQNVHVDQMARDGIRLTDDGPMAPNNIGIANSEIKRCERYGINASNGASLYVSGTDVSGAGEYGIVTDRMLGVAIHGCHLEFNGNDSPRSDGLDRDGDGESEPVSIGLSPDPSHDPTTAVSIIGNRIGYPPNSGKVGIKLGNVEGVEIASNWNGWSNRGLVELSPNIRNVSVHNNTKLYSGEFSEGLIVGPLDGSNIPPRELNGGVWRTADFANYDELATLANDHVANRYENAIEVVLDEGRSGTRDVVSGADFPGGTLFRGVGSKGVRIESTGSSADDYAVSLTKPGQRLENLVVDAAGSGVHVAENAEQCSVADVLSVSQHTDIDVDGEAARIVGCDASVDASDVDQVLDLSIDSGGLPPLQSDDGDGDDDARTVNGMKVLTLHDGAGTVETTTERMYEGDDAIRVTDRSESEGCVRGAYETTDATDYVASVYVNTDVDAGDTKHHAQSIYLGRNADGDHVSAGVANPGAANDPKLFVGAHGESGTYEESAIQNWAKDTWYRLDARKDGLSVDVELVDPSDDSTVASASFTLPGELDERVGILGGFGAGQLGNLYFDEFVTSPL